MGKLEFIVCPVDIYGNSVIIVVNLYSVIIKQRAEIVVLR